MKTVFLIMGAPKSGTAASSHLMSQLGIDFGETAQLGFHTELKWVNDFNNLIIEALGYQYPNFFLPVEQDFKAAGTHKIEPFIAKLLDVEWPEQALIGLKDPRLALTFPVWEQVLLNKGYHIQIIHVFRCPAQILNLNTRFWGREAGWADMKFFNFWLQLNLATVYFGRYYPIYSINYDDLVSMPEHVARKFADRFQLDGAYIASATQVIEQPQAQSHDLLTGYPFVDRCYELLATRSLTPDYYLKFRETFLPASPALSVASPGHERQVLLPF